MKSIATLLCCAALALTAQAKNLTLSFEPRAAIIDKITKGGDVVVFSIAREQVTYQWGHTIIWRDELTDTDGDGSVRFETPDDIEPNRLWVIVDQASGDFLVRRTDGESRHIAPGRIKHNADSAGGTLVIQGSAAHVIVVRPGEDTWRDVVGDGGDADEDGQLNGATVIRAGKLKGFKKPDKKTDRFRPNDTVVVIDPMTLAVHAGRIE